MSHIINVTVDKQTATVSRVGFGTPLIMSTEASADSKFPETARVYNDLDGLGSAGDNFDINGVTYKMAQTIFAQNQRPSQIVIGKRSLPPLMTVDLTPTVIDNTAYTVTINGEVFTFTSAVATTDLLIVGGLLALINAGAQNVLASGTTVLQIEAADTPGGTATAGKPYSVTFNRLLLAGQNVTADPGIVTDLNLVRNNIDGNDDWYALLVDSFGEAEVISAAANIETLQKIYLAATFDNDNLTSSATSMAALLAASNYERTGVIQHETPLVQDMAAAIMGKNLPTDPGSITWMFKDVAGPASSKFTANEATNLAANSVNSYVREFGNDFFQFGTMANGEFIDVIRGVDFVVARIMEAIFLALKTLPKVPINNNGIGVIESAIRGVTDLAVSQTIFNPDPVITMPKAIDIPKADKLIRLLDDITVEGELSGAVHAVGVKLIITI